MLLNGELDGSLFIPGADIKHHVKHINVVFDGELTEDETLAYNKLIPAAVWVLMAGPAFVEEANAYDVNLLA